MKLILGVNDTSSCPSVTSDDFINDQDRSLFDGSSSTTDGPDEHVIDDDLNDDDDDSFEVLSFEAPPESSLYIKGMFLSIHLTFFFNS